MIYLPMCMYRIDTTELIANQFRMSQTREKLQRDNIKNQKDSIAIHEAVEKEVRTAIAKIGGTPPEDIPAVEHIKKVEKRIKTSKPLLTLQEKDAASLIP